VLYALEDLHADGVAVLNLKPANVLLTSQDRAVLSDFGRGAQQRPGQVGGRGLQRTGGAEMA
jgi:serine/threonine protein kinase